MRGRIAFGVDLGTSTTRICNSEQGIVRAEPTLAAVHGVNSKLLAVGIEAKAAVARAKDEATLVHPVNRGVVGDLDLASALIGDLAWSVFPRRYIGRAHVVASVPTGITHVEARAAE